MMAAFKGRCDEFRRWRMFAGKGRLGYRHRMGLYRGWRVCRTDVLVNSAGVPLVILPTYAHYDKMMRRIRHFYCILQRSQIVDRSSRDSCGIFGGNVGVWCSVWRGIWEERVGVEGFRYWWRESTGTEKAGLGPGTSYGMRLRCGAGKM